jgi:CRISPR-associated endonuclease Csn1
MFKHRGHFLNASLGTDNDGNFVGAYNEMVGNTGLSILAGNTKKVDPNKICDILSSRKLSKSVKRDSIVEEICITKEEKAAYECIKAICGLAFDANTIFEENQEKYSLNFSDAGYEDKESDIITAIGEDNYSVIESMKSVYDAGVFAGIMLGQKYLSDARISDYEKHKKDLKILKKVIRKYHPEVYAEIFRSGNEGSYSAYVNSTNSEDKQRRSMKKRKKEDFYKTIKKY